MPYNLYGLKALDVLFHLKIGHKFLTSVEQAVQFAVWIGPRVSIF